MIDKDGDCDNDEDDDEGDHCSSLLLVFLQLWTSENQGDEAETGDADN